MSTEAAEVHPAFEGLVDDAALFPPGNAPMGEAVEAHLRHRDGPFGALLGRFLCPASRLAELEAALDGRIAEDDDLLLGVVMDTGAGGVDAAIETVEAEPRLVLAMVELPLPADADDLVGAAKDAVEALPDLEAYVEIPRRAGWADALALVGDSAYGAKLRTGGATTEHFPSDEEVTDFLVRCVADEVPFKCTAGLHDALRHRDPETGFEHHGFLNILVATAEAVRYGATRDGVLHVIGERDPDVLAARFRALELPETFVARSFFVAYGSCSFDEPVEDLVRLGLLEDAR
jgi:hypothetical protein